MLGRILASRSSLRSQNYIQLHLSLAVCVILECSACLWMLFLVSNAGRIPYSGLTELASLANYIYSPLSLGVGLIFECLACLWMQFLVSNAKIYPGFAELASLPKLYLITLAVKCLPYFPILSLSLDAMLGFEC